MKIIGKMAIALLVVGFLGFSVTGLEAKTINVKCEKGDEAGPVFGHSDSAGPMRVVWRWESLSLFCRGLQYVETTAK